MREAAVRIVDVTADTLGPVQAFLERHRETSLFLLSNLGAFGPRAGDSLYSGDFNAVVDEQGVCAVFCLTRGGNLVVQAGGRAELADEIEAACASGPVPVQGLLGEWDVARAIWEVLCARRRVTTTRDAKEILYRLSLTNHAMPSVGPLGERVRMLTVDDFDEWDRLALAFHAEQVLPVQGRPHDRRAVFARAAGLDHWWGAWHDGRLVAIASFNALSGSTGQVGGVHTVPDQRRLGWSRAVMQTLIRDAATRHGVDLLILFTGEDDVGPQVLYESLGFVRVGHFGLFFGHVRP